MPPMLTSRALRALTFALVATLLVGAALTAWRLAAGDTLKQAIKANATLEFRHLRLGTGLDSWAPMFAALHRQRHQGRMYADTMELDGCKYQYPPTALLLMEVLPAYRDAPFACSRDADEWARVEAGGWPAKPWIDAAARLAVLASMVVSALVLHTLLLAARPGDQAPPPRTFIAMVALALGLGLTFHPLIWGYELGQVQVFLNLLVALAILAQVKRRDALAGILMGVCCLFKPQYALVLAWVVLRRRWRFGSAMAGVVAAGLAVAVLKYSIAPHREYLAFLSGLARHGESFWANQTINGLLHRLLSPASGLEWADWNFASSAPGIEEPGFPWLRAGFPPELPWVYGLTLGSSAFIVLLALVRRPRAGVHGHDALAATLDFGAFVVASTIAAPIAWHHHYGAFFPLFAVALAGLLVLEPRSRWAAPALLASYLLTANALLRADLLFAHPLTGLLASNALFGALLLFAMLLSLRAATQRVPAVASPGAITPLGRGSIDRSVV